MKIRILLVFLLFSTICYAAGWDELNRVQIEDTLGDSAGVTSNRLDTYAIITDGSEDVAVLDTGSSDSLAVAIVDSSGNQIESFGGAGVQYTEGATDATITGSTMLWEDTGDTLRAVSAAKPLPVEITDASVAVTGTFYQVTQPISGTVDITETSFDATQATATNLKAQIFGDDITSALDVDANGQLQVDILTMPSTTITATDLDIRDLAVTTDDILIYANTAKDGSGTDYIPLVDADGNLQVDVLSAPTTAVTGTFYQVTQPVSGTITANAGTNLNTSTLATSAAQLADGHNVTIDNAAAGAAVNIQDGGNAITVDGSVTVSGTATVTQAGTVSVDDNASSLTVDTTGTSGLEVVQVTAADLNMTEASAVSIKNALEIMDDWDDTNYANVNVNIAGTDVSANAGVLTAQTQRMTLATDGEVNNFLGTIDADTSTIAGDTTSIDGKITACDTGAVVISSGAVTATVANISTTVATVYNVTMTDADTEYSQALTNVESLMFQCREEFDMRYAFVTGKVATPTAPWFTLKSGAVYSENFYDGAVDFTLYFASDETGKIAEIEVK